MIMRDKIEILNCFFKNWLLNEGEKAINSHIQGWLNRQEEAASSVTVVTFSWWAVLNRTMCAFSLKLNKWS